MIMAKAQITGPSPGSWGSRGPLLQFPSLATFAWISAHASHLATVQGRADSQRTSEYLPCTCSVMCWAQTTGIWSALLHQNRSVLLSPKCYGNGAEKERHDSPGRNWGKVCEGSGHEARLGKVCQIRATQRGEGRGILCGINGVPRNAGGFQPC